MIEYLKSNTIQSLLFITLTQMPVLGDALWGVLASTGLDVKYVAMIKVGAFILGLVGAVWGRAKAEGPLN